MRGAPRRLDRDALHGRLIGALSVLITATVVVLGVFSGRAFDRAIEPELANRTRLIGAIVRSEVQRALDLGIPFDSLVGLDRYLTETLHRFEEIDRISVASVSGQTLAEAARAPTPSLFAGTRLGEVFAIQGSVFSLPVLDRNRLVGAITIGVSPHFVETRLRDVFLDVMVIALVATLLAVELAIAIAVISVGKPQDRVLQLLREQGNGHFLHQIRPGGLGGLGRAAARLNDHAADLAERLAALPEEKRARLPTELSGNIALGHPIRLRLSDLNDIRLALFLLAVGSEIAAAFLPVYARAALRPGWLTPELAAAAPLLVYLGATAVLTPFGGALVRRFGARRLFLASVPPIALALLAMGFAGSVVEITLWRGVIGAAYAMAAIASQDYAIRAAADGGSAKAVGGFVAVIYGGVFCGSAIGGVVAGRFGFEAAFVTAAMVVALAGTLALSTMTGRAGLPDGEHGWEPRAEAERSRPNIRYLALLLGITIPTNATTAIFIWYLTPLMLAAAGSGAAETARVVMLYYLAVILFGSTVTRLTERGLGPAILILAGAVGSGAALLWLAQREGFWAVAATVAICGIGHTLIRTPQYALAVRIAAAGGPNLGSLRLFERFGAIAGLLASSLLLGDTGPEVSIHYLALAVLSGAGLYGIVEAFHQFSRGESPKVLGERKR